MDTLKKCAKCGEFKSRESFGPHRRSNDGLQSYCRDCQREYAANRISNAAENQKAPAVLELAKFAGNGPVIITNDGRGLMVKPVAIATSLCLSCSKGKDCVPSRALVIGGIVVSCEDHIQ